MTRRYRVTPRARSDLVDIARYTARTWGNPKRNAYLAELEKRFAWLAENPYLGRARPDVHAAYRSFAQGAHVIFYVVNDDTIDIIGIIHEARDVDGRFELD